MVNRLKNGDDVELSLPGSRIINGTLKQSQARITSTLPNRIRTTPLRGTTRSPVKQRIPLAVWSSLVSARSMTSFFEQNGSIARPDDLTLIAMEDLPYLGATSLSDYDLFLLAIYERDTCSASALEVLKQLSTQKQGFDGTPIKVCLSGIEESARSESPIMRDLSNLREADWEFFYQD
ncbi:MAG: hypothetical protein P1U89_03640 [Verrucomicrobiales bacterium]|nr:hypothetical protein [Verrucomicrobiales bacterium]